MKKRIRPVRQSQDRHAHRKQNDTSWGGVALWYHEHLSAGDTYHEKVILPNLARILAPKKGERILDAACGEGFFSRAFAASGAGSAGSPQAEIVGVDISPELIAIAKKLSPESVFYAAPLEDLSFAKDKSFDKAFCVLALQNIEEPSRALKEIARALKPGGGFVIVLNHPCFRIPKRSSWGYDEKEKIQYRRLDGYLSESKEKIEMHPGDAARGEAPQKTYSFHRPLQVYAKLLANSGFIITRIEEWNSHRESQKGPRAEAEDRARKEFPLFLMLKAQKQ